MFGKIKSLFKGKESLPKTLTSEAEKQILEKGSPEMKALLAARADTRPEVLYYLASDASPAVRRRIAANPATPQQANQILSTDVDPEVREELARKIARLLPDIGGQEKKEIEERAFKMIEQLARDQLPRVRALVAEAIKQSDHIPKAIVDKLARDIEDIVAAPILEYSPLLGDDDLREIIAAGVSSSRLKAIASRPSVSEAVASDLTATLDVPAIAALLVNENAQIREDTLDQIIDQAGGVEGLHKPLALRPQLSVRAMKRIAGFVASSLVHQMLSKSTIDHDMADDIMEHVRERIAGEKIGDEEEAALAKQALDCLKRGMLGDAFIVEQITDGHRELVIQCLALLAEMPAPSIRRVIHSKSGRAVTALAWRAGLKMRTAFEMQTKLALVPNAQLLPGKNGEDYPIGEDELEWHLSYFIDKA